LLLVFPGPLIALLIPLGVPRLAYSATRVLRPFELGAENLAGSVLNELRARARFGRALEPEHVQYLARNLRMGRYTKNAGGVNLATWAALDALKGDLERARVAFDSAQDMLLTPRSVRLFCQAWLLAEAAERGAYLEILRLTRRGPRSARRWFWRACAEQILGVRRRSASALRIRWLLSPAPWSSRELLRRALQAEPIRDETSIEPGLGPAREATLRLARAASGLFTRARVRAVAKAWQAVLDDGTVRGWLTERMLSLDWSANPDALQAKLEDELCELLREAWQRAVPDGSGSAHAGEDDESDEPWLLLRARDSLQDELLSDISPLTQDLPTDQATSDGGTDFHLQRWAEIRFRARCYFDVVPDGGAVFYDSFGKRLLNHGAWLHNRQRAYALAHDIFAWLRAVTPRDNEDAKLLKTNQRLSGGAAWRQ
jgi:hypothetical protein